MPVFSARKPYMFIFFFFKVIPDLFKAVKNEDQNALQKALCYIASCLRQAHKEFEQINGKYYMPENIQSSQSRASDFLRLELLRRWKKNTLT